MKSFLLVAIVSYLYLSQSLFAQSQDLPQDYLSKEFHAARRDSLRNRMPANSVVAVFAFPTRTFSNDVEYLYHQNPDLYYFTGYKEPHSLLLVFKEPQKDNNNNTFTELFFVQKRDAAKEQWTGRRLGTEGVKQSLGIDHVYNGEEFRNFNLDLSKFDKVIFAPFSGDVAKEHNSKGDLFDLIEDFKQKAKTAMDC